MNPHQTRALHRLSALVLIVLATTAVTVTEYVGSAAQVEAPRTRVCIPATHPDVLGIECWRYRQPDCPCAKIRTTS